MEDIIAYIVGRGFDDEDTKKVLGGLRFRIVRDGSNFPIVTEDLRFDRLNIEIDNGIITKAYIG